MGGKILGYNSKANYFWDGQDFKTFEDILALLIYGFVLFPNPDTFVDVNAVKIFISQNPVPTLLGDFFISSMLVLPESREP